MLTEFRIRTQELLIHRDVQKIQVMVDDLNNLNDVLSDQLDYERRHHDGIDREEHLKKIVSCDHIWIPLVSKQ